MSFKYGLPLKLFFLINIIGLSSIFEVHGGFNGSDQPRTLIQVSVFSRHGDRAPSDKLSPEDYHSKCFECFWPRGFANLTDAGIYRMTKLGNELRRRYSNLLTKEEYSINEKIKAFSSNTTRCIESLYLTLRGLLNPETSRKQGFKELSNDISHAKSSFDLGDLKDIHVDYESKVFLSWLSLQGRCTNNKLIYPASKDLYLDPDIKSLPGIDLLAQALKEEFGVPMDISILALFSSIKNELEIERTASTIHYLDPIMSWFDKPVPNKNNLPLTLVDIAEQCVIIYFNNQFTGRAKLIQVGSILTSIVHEQRRAITSSEETNNSTIKTTMNFYTAHDSTLQVLLSELGIIDMGQISRRTYEQRFAHAKSDRMEQFLNGIRLPEYGATIVIELQLVHYESNKSLPVIRILLYNDADPHSSVIHWHPIKLGDICRDRLERRGFEDIDEQFYPDNSKDHLDLHLDCPMQLFEIAFDDYILAEGQDKVLCERLRSSKLTSMKI